MNILRIYSEYEVNNNLTIIISISGLVFGPDLFWFNRNIFSLQRDYSLMDDSKTIFDKFWGCLRIIQRNEHSVNNLQHRLFFYNQIGKNIFIHFIFYNHSIILYLSTFPG